MKKITLFLIALFYSLEGQTQDVKPSSPGAQIDSLMAVLKKAKEDTSRVNTLNVLSIQFTNISNYDSAMRYANDAYSLAEKLIPLTSDELLQTALKKGKASAINNIGVNYYQLGNYSEALKNYFAALKIREEIGDRQGIAAIYNGLANIYSDQGNFSDALKNHFASLKIFEEIGDKKGAASAYNNIGGVYRDQGDYTEALKNFLVCLKLNEETGNKKGIAGAYLNIANIYDDQSNFPEALKNNFAALRLFEEIGNKKGIAMSYGHIGGIYTSLGNYADALKMQLASLKIRKEIGNKKGIAVSYLTIGNIYNWQGNYPEALKNYFTSLKISEEIGDKNGISDCYANIGGIYNEQGNYSEALKNHFAALKIKEETGDKQGVAITYLNLGEVSTKIKKLEQAKKYLEDGLALAKEIGSRDDIKSGYRFLSMLDSAQGNYLKAYEHYKMYVIYKDSLINEENTKKTVRSQMQYEFDKKESVTKAEQEKKDLVSAATLQKQRMIKNSFIGGFAVVLFFSIIFFGQRNRISKEKRRSDELLLNILPAETAEELKQTGEAKTKSYDLVTVIFTDFKNFTQVSERMTADELVKEIHFCYSKFDTIISKYGIEKIKSLGDGYMCAGGLPVENKTNPEDAVKAAIEIQQFIVQLKKERASQNKLFFEARVGVHTGPVVAGIVGIKKFAYDIWGDTVNIASRIESSGEVGKVNISGATYELVKDKFICTYRGKIEAKHKGEIDMYFVENKI